MMEAETVIIMLLALLAMATFVGLYFAKRALDAEEDAELWEQCERECAKQHDKLLTENVRQAEVIGSLQDKLFAIADATRNGKSGTARMVYRMTGRDHVAF